MFAGVLGVIAHALPAAGLAALRFWGQTGERSDAWIAAADPVHLEARLSEPPAVRQRIPVASGLRKEVMREIFLA